MEINKTLLLKPELMRDLIIYTREEKKGYYTFRFNTPALENETLLNSVCTTIISMCDGSNTIYEILCFLKSKYNVAEDILLKDLMKTLEQFTYFQLISWKEENPFEKTYTKELNNNYLIKTIGYEQIYSCTEYIREISDKNTYINPYLNESSILDPTLLKTGHLTKAQFIFGLFNKDNLEGILICANNAKTSVNTIIYFSTLKNVTSQIRKDFFEEALEMTISLSKKKITKFRLFTNNERDEKMMFPKFNKDYILKNELSFGKDIIEYNYNLYE